MPRFFRFLFAALILSVNTVDAQPFWVTSISGSGYTGTLYTASPGANSTVYCCYNSGLTLNSNTTATSISSGGKTYYRKWQYSTNGTTWFTTTFAGAGYATSSTISGRYYRVCYSYSSSSIDIIYPSPWVRVILGPSFVASPTNLTTTNITATGFRANWTTSSTACAGGGLAILHRIDVSTDASFSTSVSGYPKNTTCITNGAISCSYDVTGLTTGQTYYWRILAMSYHVGSSNGDLYCGVNSSYVSTSFYLPINLVRFDAVQSGSGVMLYWTTATEVNNDYFTLEKSTDNENWIPFGDVNGAGNSNELISYTFEDKDPMPGTSYYRLKQTDFNGAYEYYGPVAVECSNAAASILVYPNPAPENVVVVGTQDAQATIFLCDLTGRVIAQYPTSHLSEPTILNLEGVDSGLYLIRVDCNGLSKFYKVLHK